MSSVRLVDTPQTQNLRAYRKRSQKMPPGLGMTAYFKQRRMIQGRLGENSFGENKEGQGREAFPPSEAITSV